MKFYIYLFLSHCIIYFNRHNFCVKALIGQNVRQVSSGEYAFVASVMQITPGRSPTAGDHFCTGVFISKQDILTAAHCLENESVSNIQIVIGAIDLRNGTVYYPLWWMSHDQWAITVNVPLDHDVNDLAVIRIIFLSGPSIIPARFSRLDNNELYGADVKIAGWGLNNDNIVPDIMNIANVKIIENNICETKVERITGMRFPLTLRIFCSYAEPYILLTLGDSGGPLIFRNRLIGINKGRCPHGDNSPPYEKQINLHIGINYYREFINFMKYI